MSNMLRAGIPDVTNRDIQQIFYRALGRKKPIFNMIVNILNSKDKYEHMSQVTGLGFLGKKDEGVVYTADEILQMYNKQFTHDTWGGLVRASRELIEDDRSGKLNIIPAMFGDSMRATIEQEVANIIDRSQNGDYLGADGVVLASTAHPYNPDTSSVFANRPTNNVDFSLTALEDMCARMWALKNARLIPDPREVKYIVAHPNNKIAIEKALGSQKVVDSGDNDKNVVSTYGIDYIANPFLTDTDLFAGLTSKEDHQLLFIWRIKPSTEKDTDILTKDGIYTARARWSSGWLDPRGVDISLGA